MSVPWIKATRHEARRWWVEVAPSTGTDVLIRWAQGGGVGGNALLLGWWDATAGDVKPVIARGYWNATAQEIDPLRSV